MPSSIPLKPWQKAKDAGYHVVEQTTATDLPSNDYKATTTITNWPTSPRSLHKSKTALFGEIALLIFPIAFMGLAATAWSFDQKRTSEGGKTLQRIMLFGPTLFPLAFAALGGRSLRNIARWKAERGSTIGVRFPLIRRRSSRLTHSIGTREIERQPKFCNRCMAHLLSTLPQLRVCRRTSSMVPFTAWGPKLSTTTLASKFYSDGSAKHLLFQSRCSKLYGHG
jgi:hypothetical protein